MLRISRISKLIGRNEGLKGERGRDGLRRRGKQGKMSQANSLTLNDGHDSALLNSRRTLEAIGVDTCIWNFMSVSVYLQGSSPIDRAR